MALRETTIELDVLVDADPLRELNDQINSIANNLNNMGNVSTDINQNITRHFRDQGQSLNNVGRNLNGLNREYGNLTQVTNNYYNNIDNSVRSTNRNLDRHSDRLRRMDMMYANLDGHAMAMHMNMRRGWSRAGRDMAPFLGNLIQARHGFFQLAQGMNRFRGTNRQFMGEVDNLAGALRNAQNAMINNSLRARQSFLEQIGLMRNMTTQASRISSEYQRMGNPFYNINRGGLAVADTLNRIANRGGAASLALARLGPTASMVDLRNMTQMISQGLMRFQMVAIGAAVTSFFLYKALWKAAAGPDVTETFQKITDALANYRDAVKSRTEEIANAWTIFEKVQLNKTTPKQLLSNLQGQVNALRGWKDNLASIAGKTSQEFSNYLAKLGPTAAGEVAKVNAMTRPQLDKYVSLWREKMGLAREQAVTELEGLRIETNKKIQDLKNSLTPLGIAFEQLKSVWATALKPMVAAFSEVMVPLVKFATQIGILVTKFNEAHPLMAKLIQGFLMLIPIVTLLLSPLAIGIGLVAGFHAAFASLWPIIAPLVTGIAAMSATTWLLIAALIAVVVGVVAMYNKFAWFRDFINGVWSSIVNAATIAWNFILNSVIIPVMNAMSAFFTTKLAQIKLFWALHGTEIMNIVKLYLATIKGYITIGMGVIKGVFQAVWPILSGIVKIAWAHIQIVISTAINLVLGIIRVGMALLQGDWKGAWEAIKGTARAIWSDIRQIISSIDLFDIGRKIIEGLATGIKSAVSGVVAAAEGVWAAVKGVFSGKSVSVPVTVKTNGGAVPRGTAAPVAAKVGLGRVPYDDFAASLHKDEAVLTARQANTLRSAGMLKGDGMGPSLNMNASDASDAPASSAAAGGRTSNSLVFNPVFNFEGKGSDNSNIKQQFDDMKDEMFSYLTSVYDPGVDY